MNNILNALSIAGTDPSGGAGIQADLKTFSALGAYGMSVITALVAQNTQGVQRVFLPPTDFIRDQLKSVFDDIRVDTIKIGMLANSEVINTVADFLQELGEARPYMVVDPVMVAKSGDPLLTREAITSLKKRILPLADLITPNLPEAAALLDEVEVNNVEDMRKQASRLLKLGAKAVLLKGGHLQATDFADVLAVNDALEVFKTERVKTRNTHGTGCTLSSALAVCVPRSGLKEGIRQAQSYVYQAIRFADQLNVGHGNGPTHHFFKQWSN